MFRNGLRAVKSAVKSLAALGVMGIIIGLAISASGQSAPDGVVLTEADAQRIANTALAYAEVVYIVGDEEKQGIPYVWGGRTNLADFQAATAFGGKSAAQGGNGSAAVDGDAADAMTGFGTDLATGISPDPTTGLGLDASGLVVAVLRDVLPGVRFSTSVQGKSVLWADATSTILYEYNSVPIASSQLRAGDLVFFGTKSEGSATSVGGVGIVTGSIGTRIDFVVASAGQGRVIHTFARSDGTYWQNNIVGGARLVLPRGADQ